MNLLPKDPAFKRNMRIFEKGFKSIPLLDGKRKRRDDPAEFLEIERREESKTPLDQWEYDLRRTLKDDTLTNRVLKLREEHPNGTAPELVALNHLQRVGADFTYQAALFGGNIAGGIIPDFVVHRAGSATAIMIQGIYWHNRPGQALNDEADKLRLLGQDYYGKRITNVVYVWEDRLMADPDVVMDAALQGIELSR